MKKPLKLKIKKPLAIDPLILLDIAKAIDQKKKKTEKVISSPTQLKNGTIMFESDKFMDKIEFVHLSKIAENEIIELMNNNKVVKHLPLLTSKFTASQCQRFLKQKQELWDEFGYGPWAVLIKGEFAGWGGLQPEQGEVDFALVLKPKFWGWGLKIFNLVKNQAFNEMGLDSFIALLPPLRRNSNAILRIGFIEDGQLNVEGQQFARYRFMKR